MCKCLADIFAFSKQGFTLMRSKLVNISLRFMEQKIKKPKYLLKISQVAKYALTWQGDETKCRLK